MTVRKFLTLFGFVFLTLAVFTGCGSPASDEPAEAAAQAGTEADVQTADGSNVAIGLVTDIGGVFDQSFNQSAWEGLLRLEAATGARVESIESQGDADYEPNIAMMVDEGMDLIWGVGFMLGDHIRQAGIDYPDQQFAIIDYSYDPEDVPNNNITGVVFAAEQCSFLVGFIAGRMTETGIVGHINGIPSPTMETFAVGFYAGVLTADPDVEIIGQYSGSFTDAAAGRSIANQFYADGADIIFTAAGAVGNGAIEAAVEQNRWAIGVDRDQNYIAPNNVLTSALKRVDNAMYSLSREVVEGIHVGGQTRLYDLSNEGVGFATTGDFIPDELLAELDDIVERIISGDIVVPTTFDEIEEQFPGRFNMPPV
jgi:basic membrane protein A